MKNFKNLPIKKLRCLSLILACICLTAVLKSQMPAAITIEPFNATAYDELTLIFDPDSACFESASLTGLDSIAMHTGVTYLTGATWQNVVYYNTSGVNGQSTTMLPTGDGKFSITYTPADFYGLNGEIVTQICAVFNNGTNWFNDGRDFVSGGSDCMDFFIPLNYESTISVIHVPGDYPTIQEGLNAASPGDTVLVAPGTYYETIELKDNVNLVGSGYENTIIDGQGIGNENGSVVVGAEGSLLTKFTIQNANLDPYNNLGAAVDGGFASFVIKENKMTNCRIGISSFASTIIENNLIVFNPGLCAIGSGGNSYPIIKNNTILSNGRGIQVQQASFPEIKNNIIMNNAVGIWNFGGNSFLFTHNDVFNNSTNYQDMLDMTGINGNISENPQFVDLNNGDFNLQEDSPCIDAGNPTCQFNQDNTICDIGACYFDQRPVFTLDATEITSETFVANWEAAFDATSYQLDIATDPYFSQFVAGYNGKEVGNVVSYLVSALDPLSSYYYRIRANYYFGRSGNSNVTAVATHTSINELEGQSIDLKIYPNPTSDIPTVEFYLDKPGMVIWNLVNSLGQIVISLSDENGQTGIYKTSFDVSDLPTGLYFFTLEMDNLNKTKKLIIN
jgi:parallel beta-helix repeat protein